MKVIDDFKNWCAGQGLVVEHQYDGKDFKYTATLWGEEVHMEHALGMVVRYCVSRRIPLGFRISGEEAGRPAMVDDIFNLIMIQFNRRSV